MAAEAKAAPPLCTRCKEQDGVLDLRSKAVCQTCFTIFVASKAIKRLEVLQRETRGPRLPSHPQRYLLALSRGPSSTALLHILSENVRRQRERNQRVKFELVPVFVDVDLDVDVDVDVGTDQRKKTTASSDPVPSAPSERTAVGADTATSPSSPNPTSTNTDAPDQATRPSDAFATHFPEFTIHNVLLSGILSSREIDWASLPAQDASLPPSRRLADLFSRLPSATARADVSRLLTRHALFAAAAAHDCGVVLLGYNTTSLAELTLAEAAKGRGFGIPWFVNDGAFPLPRAIADDAAVGAPTDIISSFSSSSPSSSQTTNGSSVGMIHIYSPLREIFRKEILTYLSIISSSAGPLTDLFPSSSSTLSSSSSPHTAAVVSHRDLSLDDVVARYFVDVEASYPSVVANVVRTTGKLNRTISGGRQCELCGGGLDPLGDERWKGEIGEADANGSSAVDNENADVPAGRKSRLCYGCERSVKG